MLNFHLEYARPLFLLLLIPALFLTFFPYFKTPKKYRRTRNRIISVVLHTLALLLAVNLLAGLTFAYEVKNAENEVIILVDATDSGAGERQKKDAFVQQVISVCDSDMRVGVVKFGFDQVFAAELSNDPDAVFEAYLASKDPDTTATDISAALRYAEGLFTNKKTAKIVLISDGIETDGTAASVIKSIAANGVRVDTVCFPNEEEAELQFVSASRPDKSIRPGEEFTVDITLRSNLGTVEREVTLRLFDNGKEIGTADFTVNREEVTLPVALTLNERGLHEFRFEIETDNDKRKENNSYCMYLNLEIFDNILLIERYEGEAEKLSSLLAQNFNLTDMSIENDLDKIPRDIETLAQYEQVVLVNIAYSDMPKGFEELLNRYVYDLGGGLFTVGGRNETVGGKPVPHAYNREDLANSTYYKQMLPISAVDFTPPIAVMIVVDTSASMSAGNKLQSALEGAKGCLDALSDRDFCGVMAFESNASEVLQVLPVSQKETILDKIESIGKKPAAGNTVFSDAIMKAGRALSVIQNVERKHIILVTDGDPGDAYETYLTYIQDNAADGITMSIVTVNAESFLIEEMENAAKEGGGKFYNVKSSELSTLPDVMQKDLALEAIAEIGYGEEFVPTLTDRHPATQGVTQQSVPPLTGYYGTVAKKDATVLLTGKYVPIYAEWKYGAGKVGSFMSDLGGEWSVKFMDDLVGRAIVSGIVRELFPLEDVRADALAYEIKADNYTVRLNVFGVPEGQTLAVTVEPLSDTLLDLAAKGIRVEATESNRRFTFTLRDAGLYAITLTLSDEAGLPVSETVIYRTFSYSEEYSLVGENTLSGEELMTLLAEDGKGAVIEDPVEVLAGFARTLPRSVDPRVTFLILAIVCILVDIAVRKFQFKWPHEIIRERKLRLAEKSEKGE